MSAEVWNIDSNGPCSRRVKDRFTAAKRPVGTPVKGEDDEAAAVSWFPVRFGSVWPWISCNGRFAGRNPVMVALEYFMSLLPDPRVLSFV